MTTSGYIRINLAECPWHRDANTLSVFLHLLSAVSDDGVVTTSQSELSTLCGITRQCVRTALKKLQVTKYLTIQVTKRSTELIINGIDSYKCEKIGANQATNQVSNQPEKESTKERGITKKRKDTNVSKEKKEDALLGYVDSAWMGIFQAWLEYKKARKESYKTEQSLKLCYRKLQNLSNNDLHRATEIIEEAMANNWAGFFARTSNYTNTNNGCTNKLDSTIGRKGDFSSDI